MVITYREREFIDKYRCIDTPRKIRLFNTWIVGGLLYGYKNQFEVVTIPLDMIDKKEG